MEAAGSNNQQTQSSKVPESAAMAVIRRGGLLVFAVSSMVIFVSVIVSALITS